MNAKEFEDSCELAMIKEWKKSSGIIFVNGCFDILHPGHFQLFDRVKEVAKKMDLKWTLYAKIIYAINSDESVKRLKGPNRPYFNQEFRKMKLEKLSSCDCVLIFDEDTPIKFLELIRPHVIIKGDDWKEKMSQKELDLADECIFIPVLKEYSTSHILEKIKNYGI
ncbi:MAG: adenylyltransferase/cytidyltransferase family protein [Desulfobacteraceae bacterium]|nr:adenylyltransferase/cytidyltransferase family protein [Desulfobacteraceae bacterium]